MPGTAWFVFSSPLATSLPVSSHLKYYFYLTCHDITFFCFPSYFSDFSFLCSLFGLSCKCWGAPDPRLSPLSHLVPIFFLAPQSKKENQRHHSSSQQPDAFSAKSYHHSILPWLHMHVHTCVEPHIYLVHFYNCFLGFSLLGYKPHENSYLQVLAHLTSPSQ